MNWIKLGYPYGKFIGGIREASIVGEQIPFSGFGIPNVRDMVFTPNLPYIYVSNYDFANISRSINNLYGEEICSGLSCKF
jgi:hypothetical protein